MTRLLIEREKSEKKENSMIDFFELYNVLYMLYTAELFLKNYNIFFYDMWFIKVILGKLLPGKLPEGNFLRGNFLDTHKSCY